MAWLIPKLIMDNFSNSHCSQEQAAESSAASCSDGEPSVPLKSTPTPQAYWLRGKTTVVWKGSRFGQTFAVSDQQTQCAEKCLRHFARSVIGSLSAEDSLARTSPPQGVEQESKAKQVDCGWNKPASYARYDRDTHSWRTRQYSLLGGLTEYSETFPRWGTMRSGALFPLPMPSGLIAIRAYITSVKESGFVQQMPTPNTEGYRSDGELYLMFDATESEEEFLLMSNRACHSKRQKAVKAPTATVCGNWNKKGASATSGDGLATFAMSVPTPTSSIRGDCESERRRNTPGLVSHAISMPTPNASDNRDMGNMSSAATARRIAKGKQIGLSASVSDKSGSLNPDWVEWLMWWPIGWTSLTVHLDSLGIAEWIQPDWHTTEKELPRVSAGVPNRSQRLMAIGNGQVPFAAALAWQLLTPAKEIT